MKATGKKLAFLGLLIWSGMSYSFAQNPSDVCGAGVTTLTSGASCTPSAYTLPGSYANGAAPAAASCQAGQDRDDGWYQFVATGTTSTITVSGNEDRTVAVYTGSCGTGELGCDNQPGGTSAVVTVTTTVGVTYYVQVHRNSGNNTADMTGTVCVTGTSGGGGGTPTGTVQPTACANQTQTLSAGQTVVFYDDGGPGGDPCADPGVGNYCNCNCFTTTTICAAPGEFLTVSFREFAMWNTATGWDWMRIYDNNAASGTVLYDNSATGPDNPRGDCGINSPAGPALNFCSTGQCLTFEFWATSVVNRAGWDALVTSTPIFCSPPLPVELTSFEAVLTEGKVRLNWETAHEDGIQYYTVMRSPDGENWKNVSGLPATGANGLPQAYEVWDEAPLQGTAFYRLKQIDQNGAFTFSESIAVENVASGNVFVYPNPSRADITLGFHAAESGIYQLEMMDLMGKGIQLEVQVNQGNEQIRIPEFGELSPGIYLVRLRDPNGQSCFSGKVVKE